MWSSLACTETVAPMANTKGLIGCNTQVCILSSDNRKNIQNSTPTRLGSLMNPIRVGGVDCLQLLVGELDER